jgi:hypothetical protein
VCCCRFSAKFQSLRNLFGSGEFIVSLDFIRGIYFAGIADIGTEHRAPMVPGLYLEVFMSKSAKIFSL